MEPQAEKQPAPDNLPRVPWGSAAEQLAHVAQNVNRNADEIRIVRREVQEADQRLVESLDRIHHDLLALMKGQGERLQLLENRNAQIMALVAAATFLSPSVMGAWFWFQGQQLRLTTEEVVLLKEQTADLLQHRKHGGIGRDWISPNRRHYRELGKP